MSATQVELGKVAQFINGAAFKPEDWGDEGKKIIRIQNLTDPSKPYNKTLRQVDSKLVVERGDLLVSWSATLGVFEWADEDALLNQHIFRVVPDLQKVDKNYLKHSLKNAITEMDKHLHGATMKHINRGEFLATKIPLPPLAEQQRIAAILDKAAEIKAKREQAIAKLDELAMAMFEEAVSSSQAIEALGELCDVRDGTHDSPKYVAEGFPLITSKNIVDGKIDASTANLINEQDYMEICKRSKVDHGDILMPMIGTIGNPVIVKELAPKFAIKNVALIKFKSNSPSNTYINAFLKSGHFYQYVNKLSRGGTQKFLGLGDIRKLPIPMLAKESEVEFCTHLQRTTMLREQAILKLAKVNSLVSSLQHQAFTTGFNA